MNHDEWMVRYIYIPLAALTGAVSSLGARKWQTMGTAQIALSLVMGTSSAIFLTPWIAHQFLGIDEKDARAAVGLTFLVGFSAFLLLPRLTDWLMKFFGTGDAR